MSAKSSTRPGNLQPALHRTQIALDKLPEHAVVLDRFGHAWQQSGMGSVNGPTGYWYRSFGDDSEVSSFELAQRGPCRLMTASKNPL